MSAHNFDVIRFSITAGLVCVFFFFTQKRITKGKYVDWRGVDPVSTAPTCLSSHRQERI